MTIDNFYKPEMRHEAEEWGRVNDKQTIGSSGVFSKQDRRVLWGSYGSFDLDVSRKFYYEDDKYEPLKKARKLADPNGVFTPNTCAVKRAD